MGRPSPNLMWTCVHNGVHPPSILEKFEKNKLFPTAKKHPSKLRRNHVDRHSHSRAIAKVWILMKQASYLVRDGVGLVVLKSSVHIREQPLPLFCNFREESKTRQHDECHCRREQVRMLRPALRSCDYGCNGLCAVLQDEPIRRTERYNLDPPRTLVQFLMVPDRTSGWILVHARTRGDIISKVQHVLHMFGVFTKQFHCLWSLKRRLTKGNGANGLTFAAHADRQNWFEPRTSTYLSHPFPVRCFPALLLTPLSSLVHGYVFTHALYLSYS